MAALKSFILFMSCLILVTGYVIEQEQADLYEPDEDLVLYYDQVPVLSRHARSPQGNGEFELRYQKDPYGRQTSGTVRNYDGHAGSLTYREDKYAGRSAGAEYNKNLYTSRDGHVTFDAYAGANRNFDHNRNDVNAGIKGGLRW